jgi:hypothetical protein
MGGTKAELREERRVERGEKKMRRMERGREKERRREGRRKRSGYEGFLSD